MRGPAALIALWLPAAAYGSPAPPSDLDLYASSMLSGMHSHPIGPEGARLERAERSLARRRSAMRAWLVGRIGEEALTRLEDQVAEEESSVYWTHGPSEEEEWANIWRARRSLGRLERRRRQSERPN